MVFRLQTAVTKNKLIIDIIQISSVTLTSLYLLSGNINKIIKDQNFIIELQIQD